MECLALQSRAAVPPRVEGLRLPKKGRGRGGSTNSKSNPPSLGPRRDKVGSLKNRIGLGLVCVFDINCGVAERLVWGGPSRPGDGMVGRMDVSIAKCRRRDATAHLSEAPSLFRRHRSPQVKSRTSGRKLEVAPASARAAVCAHDGSPGTASPTRRSPPGTLRDS